MNIYLYASSQPAGHPSWPAGHPSWPVPSCCFERHRTNTLCFCVFWGERYNQRVTTDPVIILIRLLTKIHTWQLNLLVESGFFAVPDNL